MKHLLDVNALVALDHVAHPDHRKVYLWFAAQPLGTDFAACSITEIGFIRVTLQARLKPSMAEAQVSLAGLLSSPRFSRLGRFVDALGADTLPAYITKAADVTDGHLLVLATRHGAKLATLDTGIPGAELIK